MSQGPDTGGDARQDHDESKLPTSTAPKRSLARLLLWSSVDLDTRELSPDALGIASGVAFASALAVLYLLGTGWSAMGMVHVFTILAGLAVGVAGTYDVIVRRPVQLLIPFTHLLVVVLGLSLVLRVAGAREASRVALAWSFGLHLCLLPLSTRLWAIMLSERASGRDVSHRRQLLAQAKRGTDETLMIRVLESSPGYTEASIIGEKGGGILRLPTFLLSPRPRPGLVYVLSRAIVINRSVPGSEERGRWARYVIGAEDGVLLGDRAEVTEPRESAELARRAFVVLIALSFGLTALAAVAAL